MGSGEVADNGVIEIFFSKPVLRGKKGTDPPTSLVLIVTQSRARLPRLGLPRLPGLETIFLMLKS